MWKNGVSAPWSSIRPALSSYTSQLKLFFSCGDKEKFFDVMKRLRASDITIDSETLELIRTFM